MKLANRTHRLTSSLTLAIDSKAKAMKAQGIDLCNLTVGEPDFDTPTHVREAAKKALDQGKTRYSATPGEPKLRELIAEKLERDNGLVYKPEQIVVSNGGKHSLFNIILALIDPGDEVIIPSPYWLSYPEMVNLAAGTPVIIKTTAASRFKISAEQLQNAITPKTKLLILNSPSNPTGMVYTKEELQALADVIVKNDLHVISDEIYEKLIYTGKHISIASLGSDIFNRTILCNGFAKAYAMTGWRLGYCAAPMDIANAVSKIQSHSTSNVCTFSQYGAIAALLENQDFIEKMKSVFAERLDMLYAAVSQMPLVSCPKPDGAFYLFIDIQKTGMKSFDFCDRLLEHYQVAAVPGIAFGDDGHIRLSYATDMETLRKSATRISQFLQDIQQGRFA